MNLDQELRATLGREAELRTAPPPDVAGIISGGRVRRRRRNMARVGVAAAVTVLVAGAAYGVTQLDRSDPRTGPGIAGTPTQPSEPATIPPPLPDGAGARPPLEPGSTYRVLVGTDTAFDKIEADWTVEGPNWVGGDYDSCPTMPARPTPVSVSTSPTLWQTAPVASTTSRTRTWTRLRRAWQRSSQRFPGARS